MSSSDNKNSLNDSSDFKIVKSNLDHNPFYNTNSINNQRSSRKVKYNPDMNLVHQKINQYMKDNPNTNVSYELIQSIILDVEKETKPKSLTKEEQNRLEKAKLHQQQLHHDFCDVFDI